MLVKASLLSIDFVTAFKRVETNLGTLMADHASLLTLDTEVTLSVM